MGGSGRANAVSGWLLVLAVGCSAHHGRDDLVVGRDPKAGSGAAQAGAPNRNSGVAGTSASASGGRRALTAAIQNREGVTLDVVTVGCAGSCYEVVAVARGGYPPYSYQWEDGSSDAARTLCPDATRVFSVVAQDRGYSSAEFTREPEAVEAKVTAEVLACPLDAGIPSVADASTPDAGSGAYATALETALHRERFVRGRSDRRAVVLLPDRRTSGRLHDHGAGDCVRRSARRRCTLLEARCHTCPRGRDQPEAVRARRRGQPLLLVGIDGAGRWFHGRRPRDLFLEVPLRGG